MCDGKHEVMVLIIKGCTALYILADIGTYQWKPASEISAFLIENGADINVIDYARICAHRCATRMSRIT